MKKAFSIVLIGIMIFSMIGCGKIKNSDGTVFTTTPDDFVKIINSNLEDLDINERLNPEVFTDETAYDSQTIRYYNILTSTMALLLNADGEIASIRFIFDTDSEYNFDRAKLNAESLVKYCDTTITTDALENILNGCSKYETSRGATSKTINSVTYSYKWENDAFIFTATPSQSKADGWTKTLAQDEISFRIPENWTTYMEYEKLGTVYETSGGLKVSILSSPLNKGMINLIYGINLKPDDAGSVTKYLSAEAKETLKSIAKQGGEVLSSEIAEKTFLGRGAVESVYKNTTQSEPNPVETKEMSFVTGKNKYMVNVFRSGPLSQSDLNVYEALLDTIKLN